MRPWKSDTNFAERENRQRGCMNGRRREDDGDIA